MLNKLFLAVSIFFLLLLTPKPVLAQGEFSSSYSVFYDVDSSGLTSVTENVVLKNLTERYYATSFNLTIGASQITDVSAADSQGPLIVEVNSSNQKTEIVVRFTQQVVGVNKEYPWTLKFKSKDFAQAQGKIWQVSVPKISSSTSLDNYSLTLSVPDGFGDPTSIIPEPRSQSEGGGKLNFNFTKDQLLETGILANFGTNQLFDYSLTFQVTNPGILPGVAKLPLPPDTQYQEVIIQNIDPKPDNVTVDEDGNYIAEFKLKQKETKQIKLNGLAKLYINQRYKVDPLTTSQKEDYTRVQKYWDVDNPAIKSKLDEIFKDKNPQTNKEKARLINKYVSNFLQYDEGKLKDKNYDRLGALTSLNNPTQALCSEYSDLFITLARAAKIPARMLTGYAYTANTGLRPLSLDDNILHAWVEYFDSDSESWIMIDPTWESTTGGVDYFSKFDLNHFVLTIRGLSSQSPSPADDVVAKFADQQFNPNPVIKATIESPTQTFAGFPAKATVKIENNGNAAFPKTQMSFTAAKVDIPGSRSITLKTIPPFGHTELEFDLRTSSLWESYEDILQLRIGQYYLDRKITIKPFFAFKIFSVVVAGVVGLIMLSYFGIFVLHFRSLRDLNLPEKLPKIKNKK